MLQKKILNRNAKIKKYAHSRFAQGDKFYDRGDFFTAFRIFLEGAKMNDRDCQVRLGHMYDEGNGIRVNLARAIYWYRKSNINGKKAASMTNLFLIYRDINHKKEEMHYLRQSALLGNEEAQRELSNAKGEEGRIRIQKRNRMLKRRKNRKMVNKNRKSLLC